MALDKGSAQSLKRAQARLDSKGKALWGPTSFKRSFKGLEEDPELFFDDCLKLMRGAVEPPEAEKPKLVTTTCVRCGNTNATKEARVEKHRFVPEIIRNLPF